MKNIIIKSMTVIIACLIVIGLFPGNKIEGKTNDITIEDKLILQVPVLSDTHICNEAQKYKLINALKDYKNIAPNYKVIAFVGDITNTGANAEYDDLMKVIGENTYSNSDKIFTMGNHEYFEGIKNPSFNHTPIDYQNRFIEKTKMPGIYYDKWICGYHFIAISGEKLDPPDTSNGGAAVISENQFQWLENTLSVNAAADRPIFVFLHQPIFKTTYGSDWFGTRYKDDRLRNILNKYPQVILFSGHTHFPLTHPRSVYQDGFTMASTGSLAYLGYDGGDAGSSQQGLLVNIYKDKIEIKAREFNTGTWVNSYTIKVPFTKTIDDKEKPYFENNLEVTIDDITNNSATLTWTSAKDNIEIDRYDIICDNKVIQSDFIRFWEKSKSDKNTITITNLEHNKEYDLKIVAVDAWKNISQNSISVKLKTKQ